MKKRYPRLKKLQTFLPYSVSLEKIALGNIVACGREIFPLILDTINSTERHLDIAIFQANISGDKKCGVPYTLFTYIWNLRERGVIVRLLLNKKFASSGQLILNFKTGKCLKEIGVNVRYVGGKSTLHTKLIIADGMRAYIGSSNLTVTSLCDNYEIGVKIEGERVEAVVLPYFKKLWDISEE